MFLAVLLDEGVILLGDSSFLYQKNTGHDQAEHTDQDYSEYLEYVVPFAAVEDLQIELDFLGAASVRILVRIITVE